MSDEEGKTDVVILSVALQSGRFKSEMKVPLFGDPAEKQKAVEAWCDFMLTAFRIGATSMDATFPESTAKKATPTQNI